MTAATEPPPRRSRLRRLAGGVDSLLDRLAEPHAFAAAALGYYAIAFLIRTLLLTGSSGDEAQLMLYGQGFAWIYDFGNPPMAGWMAAIVETVTGPSIAVALLIRYGLLAAFLILLHAAAREVFADRRTALAAALSAFGFWFFGWEALRNYMDSLVLITALMACIWLMLRLTRAPSAGGYAALALAVAAGSLGKFSFPPVLLALLAAAVASPLMRETLWSRRGLIAVGGGLVLASPPYVYALFHLERWIEVANDRLVTGALEMDGVDQQCCCPMIRASDNIEPVRHAAHRRYHQELESNAHPAGSGPLAKLMDCRGRAVLVGFGANRQDISCAQFQSRINDKTVIIVQLTPFRNPHHFNIKHRQVVRPDCILCGP